MGDKHTKKTPLPRPENGHGPVRAWQSPELRAQIDALAEQVRRLSAREETVAPVAPGAATVATASPGPAAPSADLLAVDVIVMAERAAAEIRERAEAEAERIRTDRGRPPSAAAAAELLTVLRHQRSALAVLAAETDRLAQGVEILRAQVRVLEAQLATAHEILGTSPRPPVRGAINAPAA